MRNPTRLAGLALAGLLLAGPAASQDQASEPDGRWLPFVGCWVDIANLQGPMTCIVPEGDGVAMLTVADSAVTDRRVLRADGEERPVEVAGCTGAEAAEFSADGERLFTRTRTDCGATERRTRGLLAMVGANQWVEIQALGIEDGGAAWVKRFRLAPATRIEAAGLAERIAVAAPGQAVEIARAAASSPISVEDLIEANNRTHPEAVRAWIAEQGEAIRLNADRLVQLADAGVPSDVIDVAVAVSFPDRFAVGREPSGSQDSYGYGRYGALSAWGAWSPFSPFYYDPYYYRYNRYSSYYNYGLYGPYVGYRPTVVVVAPTSPQARPGGRLVKGRGYTQGASGGTASRPSIRPTSASGSQVGASSAGSNRGSSSKGKAKRRGGGN